MSNLQAEITAARQTIRSDSYAMSIGELTNLYRDREIVIRPEFQRLFRWSTFQKSRLIESILLGIPLPTIFVMQRDDSIWEVVDGLQRLSTILEFMGELRSADDDDEILPASVLTATEYLPSLEGMHFEHEDPSRSLDDSQKISIRRAKIGVTILLPESNDKAKGELFDRLNAGGSSATPQEIRMAQFYMRNKGFADWINSLRLNASFVESAPISDRLKNEAYDAELVCRYFALTESTEKELSNLDNIDDYLTSKCFSLLADDSFDLAEAGQRFASTFDVIESALGEDAFKRFDKSSDKFKGPFSVSAFEAVTAGVSQNISAWKSLPKDSSGLARLRTKVEEMWANPEFTRRSGSGKSSRDRIPHTVPWAKGYFRP